MKWIIIATPSAFRDYLISSIPVSEIAGVIYESQKNLLIEYDVDVPFESGLYRKYITAPNNDICYYRTDNINTSDCFQIILSIINSQDDNTFNILLTGANWINRSQLSKISSHPSVNHILNIHFGDCLRYRGLDSNLWSLYHRDNVSLGISIHIVENILDAGDRVIFTPLPSPLSYAGLLESQIESAFLAISQLINTRDNLNFPDRIPNDGSGRYYGLMPSALKKQIYKRFH